MNSFVGPARGHVGHEGLVDVFLKRDLFRPLFLFNKSL